MRASEISSTNADVFAFWSLVTRLLVLSHLEHVSAWYVGNLMDYSKKNKITADFILFWDTVTIFSYIENNSFSLAAYTLILSNRVSYKYSLIFFQHFQVSKIMEEETCKETDIQILWNLSWDFHNFFFNVHKSVAENIKMCISLKLMGDQPNIWGYLSLFRWSHIKFLLQGFLCAASVMAFRGLLDGVAVLLQCHRQQNWSC